MFDFSKRAKRKARMSRAELRKLPNDKMPEFAVNRCPQCGAGILKLRDGRFGLFRACSRCKFTRSVVSTSQSEPCIPDCMAPASPTAGPKQDQ